MNCNSRGQQTTQMSTDRGRRKTLGIHMMEYDTVRRNEQALQVLVWKDLKGC